MFLVSELCNDCDSSIWFSVNFTDLLLQNFHIVHIILDDAYIQLDLTINAVYFQVMTIESS